MNRYKFALGRICCLLLLNLWLVGCAAEKPVTRRFFWPALPERPRIEWLKSYSNQNDFAQGGFSSVISGIVGETAPISFEKPLDIKSDGAGKVYVTDVGLEKVIVYDMVKKDVHAMTPGGEAKFGRPVSLALDALGNVYVADSEEKCIFVFDKSERLVRVIDTADKIKNFGGIAVDRGRQRLLCVDVRGHKVVVMSLTGDVLFSFGERGDENGRFNFPGPVAINKKGEIIIGDAMNSRVQVFTGDGKFLRKFGQRGDSLGEFQLLKGVAVDSDDNIYVTDGKGNKVGIFSPQGEFLLSFGARYSVLETGQEVAGGFVIPQGIDIDQADKIYVVDQMNLRFQVFQYISDSMLEKNPIPGYPPQGATTAK
jgi:DNA-binding beta-propeller fold protein YncE